MTIIGAGIFGLSCAWEIARRGHPVRVIEARQVGAGSSGGHVGALAPHAPDTWNTKKAFQLESLLTAPTFWAEVEALSGISSGFGRTGRVQPVPDTATADRLQARIAAAARHWPAGLAMAITAEPGTRLLPDSPTGLWLVDTLTARLNPRAALAALTAAIRARGGEVHQGTAAVTDRTSGPAIWSTGAEGLAALSQDLGSDQGRAVKGQSALMGFSAPDAPQVFAEGVHIVPHADGTTAIGSTSETDFAEDGPDDRLDLLIERARQICPALRGAPVVDRWAGMRPRARSRAPLLGEWPGRPGHFIANGGFKIGFGMAPKIAEVMADLVLDGVDRIPAEFRGS